MEVNINCCIRKQFVYQWIQKSVDSEWINALNFERLADLVRTSHVQRNESIIGDATPLTEWIVHGAPWW